MKHPVTDNMGHRRYRRKANNTQHGIEHLDDLIVGAPFAGSSGKFSTGKSYVVFGKADNTAINLSAIATNNQIIRAIAVDIACGGD
jgi:hypothetical protein